MGQTAYLRSINKARCTKCGHESYDWEFESENYYLIDENIKGANMNNICPKCGLENTMELLEDSMDN